MKNSTSILPLLEIAENTKRIQMLNRISWVIELVAFQDSIYEHCISSNQQAQFTAYVVFLKL